MSDALTVDKRQLSARSSRMRNVTTPGNPSARSVHGMLERLDYVKVSIDDTRRGQRDRQCFAGLMQRHSARRSSRSISRLRCWSAAQAPRVVAARAGLRPPLDAVCGDLERLPLRDASIGLVWSNLALQW